MQTRTLGTTDIDASVIGLGTWAMGGWMWGGTDEKQSVDAIRAALDAGVTLIDTAPAYGLGRSEELVGEAIAGRREEVVLATKCGLVWHTQQGNHFFEEEGQQVHRYLGAESIRYELEQSLRRLKTDYIDLYITHWQDDTTAIEETMITLLALKKEGRIGAIGISNASLEQLQEYQKYGPVDAIQERYNMIDRSLEQSLLPHARNSQVSCLSYSSLALGLLSGKVSAQTQFSGDDQRISDPWFSQENRQLVQSFCQQIGPIADDHGVSIAQLVIAWTLSQPGITYALCGARNPKQAQENARAGELTLSEDVISLIASAVNRHLSGIHQSA
ncbi:General stress protein 69 [Vibrio nigripulchritudo SFn27]|uniref:General stress protein 69 n=1 Tax=Vibrio nigripulchritudo TaxID=28173 RepID=U4KI52_9VIBR|nr:aldo/keto reductase [Vibrio nigripulchritudo]CCN83989.1 General stress protein 69 [Vibrio nigripulchritudo BLFn1]CCN89341.1 General stress protein 69 [Vibrio nigripulchritudo SFn27]CCN93004.1 General stress protein 69 [Vibrio nigripulchritudo ENn2]CCO40465.1 General stress protein 69 [Vibrio nigripulchritudo SFn135]CCO55751.1 General stress protein 69 [Vibrio nigripulchritudo Wn13]